MAYKRRTKSGRYADEVTYSEIKECFHLPQDRAAERLGVGVTILKRICRQYGIPRWPYKRESHRSAPPAKRARYLTDSEPSEDGTTSLGGAYPHNVPLQNAAPWARGNTTAVKAAAPVTPNLHDLLVSLGSARAPVAPANPPQNAASLELLLGLLSQVVPLGQQQHHQQQQQAYPIQKNNMAFGARQRQADPMEALINALSGRSSAPAPPPQSPFAAPAPPMANTGLTAMLVKLHAEVSARHHEMGELQGYIQQCLSSETSSMTSLQAPSAEPPSPNEAQLRASNGGAFQPFRFAPQTLQQS